MKLPLPMASYLMKRLKFGQNPILEQKDYLFSMKEQKFSFWMPSKNGKKLELPMVQRVGSKTPKLEA